MSILAFDFETYPIGLCQVAPKAICCSFVSHLGNRIASLADNNLKKWCEESILDYPGHVVAHNLAFDLAVFCANFPEHINTIFTLLEQGKFHCTKIRERLLDLTTHGSMTTIENRDGSVTKIDYSLASLAKKYLGIDRTKEKESKESWRLNFDALATTPVGQWPEEARQYSLDDSIQARDIFFAQERKRQSIIQERNYDPFASLNHKVCIDFALMLATCWGMRVDPEEYYKLKSKVEEKLTPDKLKLLLDSGILVPGEPERPYLKNPLNEDGTVRMKAATKDKISETKLKKYIEDLSKINPNIVPQLTPTKEISLKSSWFEEHAGIDPLLDQYAYRESLQKMVTTELPRLCLKDKDGKSTGIPSPVVHANFSCLVETGRTSSFAGDLYPSLNGQNVDPKARHCIIPRDGFVLFSCDYNQMELGTLAQTCINLFGFSKLADTINAGIDVHEFLGAVLAVRFDRSFALYCTNNNAQTPDQIHKIFKTLKGSPFYSHYRTFAKPTNLGYPGGLGPDKFMAYAKATYKISVDKETAITLRETWLQTFPEMEMYFNNVKTNCIDSINGPITVTKEDGTEKETNLYWYNVPGGLRRMGATYCACANGMGLQSPSAVGATWGFFQIMRACFLPNTETILGVDTTGRRTVVPINFIHDEILGETVDDTIAHDRVQEISRIMIESMKKITPDVAVRVKGCIMRRWDKNADAVFDENKRLKVWEPTVN